nr:hypothetical protein [Tanacetum cinerariifolium]GEW56055.1 hypothetical protein [Tanacetum cinerariifolium]
MQVFLDSQVEGMLKHKEIYVTPSHTKKIYANTKRQGKTFLKQKSKKSKKRVTKVLQLSDSPNIVAGEHVTTTSNDLLLSETTKANQSLEIRSLKRRVKKLEKKASKKSYKLKRLYKIGSSTRVESSEDTGLGDQEDASKQGRMIKDLDADEGVTLVDETQGRNDKDMFYTSILKDEEIIAEKEVSTADPVSTAVEVVTTAGVELSTTAITSQISMDEITLAKALIDIKTSKPKAKGIVIQEPSETPTQTPIDSSQQPSKAKDKGKAKMIEPKKTLKRKDQIMIDEEFIRNLKAHMQAELEEEERLSR